MSDKVRQFSVEPDDDGIRLDRWFKRHLPQVGFATVSRWARSGQIRVDGKRADPGDRLTTGQVVRVPPGGVLPARTATPRRELTEDQIIAADAMIIMQDRSAIVLNKPPGLATQGGTGTTEHVDGLLDAFVGPNGGPRPRLVHRLDKDTSGVLLVARTPGSAAFFSKRFAGRSARKIYWALIVGVPDIAHGFIDLPLAKQPGSGGEKMCVDEEHGALARTRYRVIDRAGNRACWVELQPLTGRTHQLRVHMAAIGHPIVGDGKYGGQEAFLTGSISRKMHLHARQLIIDHPDGTPLNVIAPLPEHFAASMEHLGFDEDAGELLPEAPPPPPREVKKRVGKAHAKQYRKERRGERRKRGDAPAPKRSDGPNKGPRKAEAKAAGKPASAKTPSGGKAPTGGSGSARGKAPATGKGPAGGRAPTRGKAPAGGKGKR